MRFHRRELHRLGVAHFQAVQIADHDLQRHRDRREADRELEHQLRRLAMALTQQVRRADAADHEASGDERGERHVRETQRERRIEHDVPPALRLEHAVDDAVTRGRVHPAVRRDDPERGDQRAERHHARREEVQRRRHAPPAEQHHAEESRFQEERGQHFVREQRAENVAGARRQLGPVGAELKAHHDARHDAERERHGEDLQPEHVQVAPQRAPRFQIDARQERQPARQSDRERGKDDVKAHHESELDPRQEQHGGVRHGGRILGARRVSDNCGNARPRRGRRLTS